jgi:hypothetical protein
MFMFKNVTDEKREKLYYALAYTAAIILTLLPFFLVGIANDDDLQFFITAHKGLDYWKFDANVYAQGQGRFYYLITKYVYYIPYLFDNFAWTKFVQYASLCVCYLMFAYLVSRVFKSPKLGALSLLFLVFNTRIGAYTGYVIPIGYPFYFTLSLIVFLGGVLLFMNYVEKGKRWRLVLSAGLFFASLLFYENYLVFSCLFICFVFLWNWKRFWGSNMWKTKSFYVELIPYVAVIVLYLACYFGYRYYVVHTLGSTLQYPGAKVAADFNLGTFFKLLGSLTFNNLPGWLYTLPRTRSLVAENSLLFGGHGDSVWFMLTHATAVAYVNALVISGILWFLLKRFDFDNISWKALALGILAALVFAVSANVLVAASEKYNAEWAMSLEGYVTSFFSYFGVMLALALVVVATLKLSRSAALQKALCVCWCVALFCFAVVNYYLNDHLSRAWMKSENRITMLRLINDEGFFNKLPDNALIYSESLHHTSEHGWIVCYQTNYLETFIALLADESKDFHFARTQDALQELVVEFPDAPVYFVQATESKKFCELMMCFSHISQLDTADIALSTADGSDIFYYSPTKEYVLFYGVDAQTDSAEIKSTSVIAADKRQKVVHVPLRKPGLDPFGFSISNLCIATKDTIWVP